MSTLDCGHESMPHPCGYQGFETIASGVTDDSFAPVDGLGRRIRRLCPGCADEYSLRVLSLDHFARTAWSSVQ